MRRMQTLVLLCGVLFASAAWADESQFKIHSGETVVFGSSARVQPGESYKSTVLLWGDLDFAGQTEELVVLTGKVKLRSGSQVTKSIVLMGGSLEQEDGALVPADNVTVKAPEGWYKTLFILAPIISAFFAGGVWLVGMGLWLLSSWVVGLAVFYLFPGFALSTGQTMETEKGAAFLSACAAGLLYGGGCILLVISIIGLFLLPLYFTLAAFVFYLGHVVAAAWLGGKVTGLIPKLSSLGWPWQLLIGIILSLSISAFVPVIGKMAMFILTFIAVGAIYRAVRQLK